MKAEVVRIGGKARDRLIIKEAKRKKKEEQIQRDGVFGWKERNCAEKQSDERRRKEEFSS